MTPDTYDLWVTFWGPLIGPLRGISFGSSLGTSFPGIYYLLNSCCNIWFLFWVTFGVFFWYPLWVTFGVLFWILLWHLFSWNLLFIKFLLQHLVPLLVFLGVFFLYPLWVTFWGPLMGHLRGISFGSSLGTSFPGNYYLLNSCCNIWTPVVPS